MVLTPFAWILGGGALVWGFATFLHTADPLAFAYSFTGLGALTWLGACLLFGLLARFGFRKLFPLRRSFGLLAFWYSLLHASVFFGLDVEGRWELAIEAFWEKPFLLLGLLGFFILCGMAITSFRALQPRFFLWHQGLYLALILILGHVVLAQKTLGLFAYMLAAVVLLVFAGRLRARRR